MTTTSTICSPPLVDPQEGLSREMTQSPPSAVVLETKCGTTGWITVGLLVCRASGRTPEGFGGRSNAEIVGGSTLVEGTELPVGPRSKTASAGPGIVQISSRNRVEYKRNKPCIINKSSEHLAETKLELVLVALTFFVFAPREVTRRRVSSGCRATI